MGLFDWLLWWWRRGSAPSPVRNLIARRVGMKARLTWIDPTTRVDGSPLLSSQILHIGIQLRSTAAVIGLVAPGVQEFTTGELTPGTTVEWAVTVEGTAEIGGKKSFPAFVGIAVPATPPPPSDADLSPVSNLTATLVP